MWESDPTSCCNEGTGMTLRQRGLGCELGSRAEPREEWWAVRMDPGGKLDQVAVPGQASMIRGEGPGLGPQGKCLEYGG